MMQHHNYSLAELENMIPWERDIYIGLLLNYIEEEKRKENNNKYISFKLSRPPGAF